ncbi:GIN domain-containing protein [Spongiimicrobium salis]|uniref:GIN domain-containing protein n=1 Tax=Spongiimicrobium salis TaxID=1667022 RepID=UPI00374D83C9
MKNFVVLIGMLFTLFTFAQESLDLDAFDGLDCTIGVTINIIKSEDHKMAISGDKKIVEGLKWEILDNNLMLQPAKEDIDYSEVTITLYTPSIRLLSMTNGGIVTLDNNFDRIRDFTAKADYEAIIDLSDVKFVNLVTRSTNGGEIRYNYSDHL